MSGHEWSELRMLFVGSLFFGLRVPSGSGKSKNERRCNMDPIEIRFSLVSTSFLWFLLLRGTIPPKTMLP